MYRYVWWFIVLVNLLPVATQNLKDPSARKCYIENRHFADPEKNAVADTNVSCCYSCMVYGSNKTLVIRDGLRENNIDCDKFCTIFDAAYRLHQDPVADTMFCQTCSYPSLCNDHVIPDNRYYCYECTNCTASNVKSVECRNSDCCYSAYMFQDIARLKGILVRGCVQSVIGKCNATCKNGQLKYREIYPHARFVQCVTCTTSSHNCNTVDFSEPNCYTCYGDDCEVVGNGSKAESAPSYCCYVAAIYGSDGLKYQRGVAAECKRFCRRYKQDYLMKDAKVVYCKHCTGDRCNNKNFEKTAKCYSCKNCDNVTNGTRIVSCPLKACCYTAIVKGNVHRGCVKWKWGDTCNNTVHVVKNRYANGTVNVCTASRLNRNKNACNGDPPITCYDCKDDYCEHGLYTEVECSNACCYSEAIYMESGLKYSRGCVSNRMDCNKYCIVTDSVDRIKCASCRENLCNNLPLPGRFKCYSCENCNEINSDTHMVECRGPECCYVKQVRETPNSPLQTNRGCIKWTLESQCIAEETRAQAENIKYSGTFKDQSMRCYNCSRCNVVTNNTPSVECIFPSFCYIIHVTYSFDEETFAVRGCTNFSNIDDACEYLEDLHIAEHPDGDFDDCFGCQSPVYCNAASFDVNAPLYVEAPAVLCYKCHNCSSVTELTKVVKCSQATCCYQASIRTEPSSKYFITRGCFRPTPSESCDDTYQQVEKKFKSQYINGTFFAGITCASGEGNNCNYDDFISPDVIDSIPIMCYNCTNCYVTNTVTPNTYCADINCCYSAKLQAANGNYYIKRGCYESVCSDMCAYFKDDTKIIACNSCKDDDADGCNDTPYDIPMITVSSISCYECHNCSQVTIQSGLVECANASCCYRALLAYKFADTLVAVRACAKLYPWQTCNHTCKHIQINHERSYPEGMMPVCTECRPNDGDKCNNRTFTNPYENNAIKCYECRYCDKITKAVAVVDCREAACCYVAYLKDRPRSNYYAIRGCAPWKPGKTCEFTCRDLQNDHLWDYPSGTFFKCIPCASNDTNFCNKYPFYTQNNPKITKQIAINCYDCANCYETTNSTVITKCPAAGCCYTALVKNKSDDFNYQVTRSCRTPDSQDLCNETCAEAEKEHLWSHPLGLLFNCTTCNDDEGDECNNKQFEPPQDILAEGDEYIRCYNCINCNKISSNTSTIKCPLTLRCYIALINKPVHAIRGCAESCPKPFYFCMTCSETSCNNNTYYPTNLSIPFTCYECRNCNSIITHGRCPTATVACHPKCCYVALVRDNPKDKIFAVRGCSKTCRNGCEDIRKEHLIKYRNGSVHFCMTCETKQPSDCNKNIFTSPSDTTISANSINQLRRKSFPMITCYNCVNCYLPPEPLGTPCPDNCCNTLVWTEYGELIAARLCADLNGTSCSSYCAKVSKRIRFHKGTVYECNTCRTNMCNNKQLFKPGELVTLSPPFRCYSCRNCTRVMAITATVVCPTSCCYTARVPSKANGFATERRCAKIMPGRSCVNYCKFVQRKYLKLVPGGVVKCLTCTTDKCNK